MTAQAMAPFIVAIEGIDRAGKTTQTTLLREALERQGETVVVLSFPRYETFFGRTIRALLDGHSATSAATVDPRSMSLWYALDRWQAFRDLDRSATVVLLNRYTLSNAVYQSCRAPAAEADALFDWVIDLEHGQLGLPRPQVTVVLDVAPSLSRARSHQRSGDGARQEAPDVYERSDDLLAAARQRYLDAARVLDSVVIVGCDAPPPADESAGTAAAALAAPDAVHRLVLDAVVARRARLNV